MSWCLSSPFLYSFLLAYPCSRKRSFWSSLEWVFSWLLQRFSPRPIAWCQVSSHKSTWTGPSAKRPSHCMSWTCLLFDCFCAIYFPTSRAGGLRAKDLPCRGKRPATQSKSGEFEKLQHAILYSLGQYRWRSASAVEPKPRADQCNRRRHTYAHASTCSWNTARHHLYRWEGIERWSGERELGIFCAAATRGDSLHHLAIEERMVLMMRTLFILMVWIVQSASRRREL